MNAPKVIERLSEIAGRYDVVLCDVWGVIHNGRESFPDACEALVRFRKDRGPVVLISNAPRPSAAVLPQLAALRVPEDAWSGFVTSGDATRAELLKLADTGKVWALGPARDAPLYDGLPLTFAAGPDDAAFVCCTGPIDDETETPDDYRAVLKPLAERRVPFVCANPDRVVQRGDKLIYCGGALADVYAEYGGPVIMAGKPYSPIYDTCLEGAARLLGRPADRARVLAVGDGVPTDVLGANAQGLDVLFVASGIHGADVTAPDGTLDAQRTAELLARAGATATYATYDLVW
jgi:HAD superfamily hydrolase (TIGR01459 family)